MAHHQFICLLIPCQLNGAKSPFSQTPQHLIPFASSNKGRLLRLRHQVDTLFLGARRAADVFDPRPERRTGGRAPSLRPITPGLGVSLVGNLERPGFSAATCTCRLAMHSASQLHLVHKKGKATREEACA